MSIVGLPDGYSELFAAVKADVLATINLFTSETRRTTAPEFRWNTTRSYSNCDPLVELFVEEAAHRKGQRPYSYRSPLFTQPRREKSGRHLGRRAQRDYVGAFGRADSPELER